MGLKRENRNVSIANGPLLFSIYSVKFSPLPFFSDDPEIKPLKPNMAWSFI